MMLLMPNIQVAGANAMSGAHVIGYPALPAFLGFANTVCRALSEWSGTSFRTKGIAILHHGSRLRRYRYSGLTRKKSVYADAEIPGRDSYWFTPPNEHQPQLDLSLSLIVDAAFPPGLVAEAARSLDELCAAMPLRCLGGTISEAIKPRLVGTAEEIAKNTRNGWFLVDRSDEITEDGDALDNLLRLTTGPDARSKRRIAVQSGYRAITPFARRRGTRSSECDHAFVEDVTTLAAFVPRRECTVSLEHMRQCFWRPNIDRNSGFATLGRSYDDV